ncbi:MAG: permease [Actinomycetota bacterium]|nr:permease [Actinomycetota bacterium]
MVNAIINAIAESLLIGLGFFYKALWPILFGVLITAAIETFMNAKKMAEILGGRDLITTGKATAAGAISSACTFGAVTITNTLFKKGASSESSFAFSFASTNLVFELGILIYVLLGPAFLAAELLGGFLLIVIMYLLVRLTLPEKTFEEARRRLRGEGEGEEGSDPSDDPFCGYPGNPDYTLEHEGVTYQFFSEPCRQAYRQQIAAQRNWKRQLLSRSGWYRIAVNYFNTMGKIYKTVIWGFLLAGFIVGLVPTAAWRFLFLDSSSFLGVLENATLGVLAGVFSFIGSIGNVPFAAALWFSGVSFAGVIALIYADLITVPVLQLWRQFLGWKGMLYVFAIFFVTMTASAVAMEYLFEAFDLIPERPASVGQIKDFLAPKLDFTLIMTIVMLTLTATLYWLMRVDTRKGAEEGTG